MTPTQALAAIVMVPAVAVPFLLLGLAIGYRLSSKAAIAVVQATLFPLAFAGGLFLPPEAFPAWLDALSKLLPSRAARDLAVQAVTGYPAYGYAVLVLLAWTAAVRGDGGDGVPPRRGPPLPLSGGPSASKRRSRSELPTTSTDENAIAAPAIIGLSRPSAASGIAATL